MLTGRTARRSARPGAGVSARLPHRPVIGVAVLALLAVVLVGVVSALPGRGAADGTGKCPPNDPICSVDGGDPGGGGGATGGPGGGGGGDGGTCTYLGAPVPCYIDGIGYYSDNCYYRVATPQPPASDPLWGSYTPDTATMYFVTCLTGSTPGAIASVDPVEEPIPRTETPVSPYQLALAALAKIRLDGPDIQLAPTDDAHAVGGLVGLPVWMWTTTGPHTWGPIGASASDGGLTVTITATGYRIAWNMGDGTTVTCDNPGTPYVAADGAQASPDCGYHYLKPSSDQAGGRYTITATTTWHVAWAGGGESGTIVTTRVSTVTVLINQAQVVVK